MEGVELGVLGGKDACLILESLRLKLRMVGAAHPDAADLQLMIDRVELAQLSALERERGRSMLGGPMGLTEADGAGLELAVTEWVGKDDRPVMTLPAGGELLPFDTWADQPIKVRIAE